MVAFRRRISFYVITSMLLWLMASSQLFVFGKAANRRHKWNSVVGTVYDHASIFNIDWKDGKMSVSESRNVRLYSSKKNKFLQLRRRFVNAAASKHSKYAKLCIESVGYGLIRIKGLEAKTYLCFNPKNAKLKVQKNGDDRYCVFEELHSEKTYKTYFKSHAETWYVAVKRNGKTRPGNLWKSEPKIPPLTMEFISMSDH